MTATVEHVDTAQHVDTKAHDHPDHPSDAKYIQIALMLGALTAAEVATYYVDIGGLLGPVLIGIMIVKFVVVAMYFMHLRFDDGLFTKVFASGIVLAVTVYLIALTSFHYFAT